MSELSQWLGNNIGSLIEAGSSEMASHDQLRSTVGESVAAFFEAMRQSADRNSMIPLHAILIDWVEVRSAPTEDDPAGLLVVLTTLKRVAWRHICKLETSQHALVLLEELESIFTEAANYLAKLEAVALVDDLQRELHKAQNHVKKLDKSKSDFIAVAAHELKTPLTIIEGYTNMLRGDFKEQDHPRVALMLSSLAGGTSRLREIIEDMIDVSMIDMSLLNLHYQPVWINRLLEMVEFDLSDALRQRRITMTVDRNTITNKPTYADAERLHQVFFKVISNAVKYTPDGGTVTVTGREMPGFMEIQVIDRGIGIALENLNHIFDKFSSMGNIALHSSGKVKFKGGGPGLGLAIAKGIIEAHGGSIWAESAGYDEKALLGSTFHIMVPMRSAPPEDDMSVLYNSSVESENIIG
jgi:signal transduction histidine kinase